MTHSAESIWRDGISFEEIRRNYFEAVTSKVVDKELVRFVGRINGSG
jgi:hypothetical protein